MRIGKQDAPYTAICTSDATSITVRGKDLVGEIIGKMDFTSYFWFLVTGEEPNEQQSFFLNAILCALAEHGLVPSVVAARMTYAAAPEALQGAVAAGLLGCGSVVLGSAEVAGAFYANCVHDMKTKGISATRRRATVSAAARRQARDPRFRPPAARRRRPARQPAA
jgi:citrate synthase